MEHTGNHITLCGTLRALPEYSHSNHERRFFRFELEVERLSGTADVLPVMAAADVLMAADLSNEEVVANAVADEKIARFLEKQGGSIVKTIVVKNKLVNLIVK